MKKQSTYALKLRCDAGGETFIVGSADIVPGEKPNCPTCGYNSFVHIIDVLEPEQEAK